MEWYYFGRWLLLTILDYFEFWCLLKNWGVVIFHHISFLAQRPCHRKCAQNKILQPTPSMAASYPCVRGGTSQLKGPRPSDAQVFLWTENAPGVLLCPQLDLLPAKKNGSSQAHRILGPADQHHAEVSWLCSPGGEMWWNRSFPGAGSSYHCFHHSPLSLVDRPTQLIHIGISICSTSCYVNIQVQKT